MLADEPADIWSVYAGGRQRQAIGVGLRDALASPVPPGDAARRQGRDATYASPAAAL
jgi:hypothetical protein